MDIDADTLTVNNNEKESRYEIDANGIVAIAQYSLGPGSITFLHTEVPKALAGRGIAQKLVKGALDHARSQKLKVVPLCSFVAGYIERHPEYKDLLSS